MISQTEGSSSARQAEIPCLADISDGGTANPTLGDYRGSRHAGDKTGVMTRGSFSWTWSRRRKATGRKDKPAKPDRRKTSQPARIRNCELRIRCSSGSPAFPPSGERPAFGRNNTALRLPAMARTERRWRGGASFLLSLHRKGPTRFVRR